MNQVVPVSLPSGLDFTLSNYYDLLKAQIGGLQADEFLQLKLVADPVDISDEKYRYWSMYNLLRRSDLAIEPRPISGSILVSADRLSSVYGRFLQRLRGYVVRKELNSEEQAKVADIDAKVRRNQELAKEYARKDYAEWKDYCDATGRKFGDMAAYVQWSIYSGYKRNIEQLNQEFRQLLFDKKTLLDRQYADPEDREIVDAEFEYDSPQMRLRYPVSPDNTYPNGSEFSLTYLAYLPFGSSALFDDRRALSWNVSLANMMSTTAGRFNASWDHSTQKSTSMATDWSYSGSMSYFIMSVDVSASEATRIQEDFKTTTSLALAAEASYKLTIQYPGWFRPELFRHKRLLEHIHDFEDLFGPNGALLYYPTHLVLVRGFGTEFKNSQAWTYDYAREFQASAGGGFGIFGFNFGDKWTYGSNNKEHQIAQANTSLKISDDSSTLRFVGYVVKKNTIWNRIPNHGPIDELGVVLERSGYRLID